MPLQFPMQKFQALLVALEPNPKIVKNGGKSSLLPTLISFRGVNVLGLLPNFSGLRVNLIWDFTTKAATQFLRRV